MPNAHKKHRQAVQTSIRRYKPVYAVCTQFIAAEFIQKGFNNKTDTPKITNGLIQFFYAYID